MQDEFGDRIEVEWKSFLLRPEPRGDRTLEQFKQYTRSWTRAAAEEPRAGFVVWSSEEGPPSHSVPPHVVAKAAQRINAAAFEPLHQRLLAAYFRENRDITRRDFLEQLWREQGLPEDGVDLWDEAAIVREIFLDHQEAVEYGASGAPAARMEGRFGMLMGAQPTEVYRRWVEKALESQAPT